MAEKKTSAFALLRILKKYSDEDHILTARQIKTSLTMRIVDTDSLSGILTALEDVLARDEEFVFDFTGGDDTALVALGMLFRLTDRKISVFPLSLRYLIKS